MKTILTCLLASFLFSIPFFSCSPDYDSYVPAPSVDEILARSAWAVELTENYQTVSRDYSEYTLLFDNRGSAMCNNNKEGFTGNWQNTNDVITLKFNSSEVNVLHLNKSWKVVAKSSTYIKFECENSQPHCGLILSKK